jgi:hypothetical protein
MALRARKRPSITFLADEILSFWVNISYYIPKSGGNNIIFIKKGGPTVNWHLKSVKEQLLRQFIL